MTMGAQPDERAPSAPSGRRTFLTSIHYLILAALAIWTLVAHTAMVHATGYTAWKLGGFGMYGEPTIRHVAIAAIRCDDDPGCRFARTSAESAAARLQRGAPISLFSISGRDGTLQSLTQGPLPAEDTSLASPRSVVPRFKSFPNAHNARRVAALLGGDSCRPRCLVVHYRQRAFVLRGELSVETRAFEVSLGRPSG